MMSEVDYFRSSYNESRDFFRQKAQEKNAILKSYPIQGKGIEGEELTIETAYIGREDAEKVKVLISGTHGAEFHAGSAILCAAMDEFVPDENTALLCIAHLNPFGSSHGSRHTQDGVDLNRNGREDFQQDKSGVYFGKQWPFGASLAPKSVFEIYRLLASFVFAGTLKKITGGLLTLPILDNITRLAGGHYHQDAVFYAGRSLSENLNVLNRIMEDHKIAFKKVVFCTDIHTGLGDKGKDELISDEDCSVFSSLQGDNFVKMMANCDVPYARYLDGMIGRFLKKKLMQHNKNMKYYYVTQEFGTYKKLTVLHALLKEKLYVGLLRKRPPCPILQKKHAEALKKVRDVFFINEPEWKRDVLNKGLSFFRAVMKELKSLM